MSQRIARDCKIFLSCKISQLSLCITRPRGWLATGGRDGDRSGHARAADGPPGQFRTVNRGVFRSGFPNSRNFAFLKTLRLRSVVRLCDDSCAEVDAFCAEQKIRVFKVALRGNKEPFLGIDDGRLRAALEHCRRAQPPAAVALPAGAQPHWVRGAACVSCSIGRCRVYLKSAIASVAAAIPTRPAVYCFL